MTYAGRLETYVTHDAMTTSTTEVHETHRKAVITTVIEGSAKLFIQYVKNCALCCMYIHAIKNLNCS